MAGIPAILLNQNLLNAADLANRDIWAELASGRYTLIAISPELLLEIPFDRLLRNKAFLERLLFVNVDEFHCIEAEGHAFRPKYRDIWKLAYRIEGKLWAIATAAATPATRRRVQATLRMEEDTTTVLVDSNNRPNITWEVRFIKRKIGVHAKTDPYSDLDWVLETVYPSAAYHADVAAGRNRRQIEAQNLEPPASGCTVIFMSSMLTITEFIDHMHSRVPPHLRSTIMPYYSMLDPSVKVRTLDQMARGTLRVLVTTKAGELGADMKGVERVVLWRPKDGLDAVLQQAGRAARQGGRGLIVVYGAPNLKKTADSHICEGAKPSKEVQAAMTTCGPGLWGIFAEQKCIRSAIDRHYDQVSLSDIIRPRGASCCNLCAKAGIDEDRPTATAAFPTGIDRGIVRQPVKMGQIAVDAAAPKVTVSRDHFEMKAEEHSLASEALDVFARDFGANCRAASGSNHTSSMSFPGRVASKIIERLPAVLEPLDLSHLMEGLNWSEFP